MNFDSVRGCVDEVSESVKKIYVCDCDLLMVGQFPWTSH